MKTKLQELLKNLEDKSFEYSELMEKATSESEHDQLRAREETYREIASSIDAILKEFDKEES